MNPEIGTRSFGANADRVIEYARQALKGYNDGGLISTGKHFPGRGESTSDAHAQLPVIDLSKEAQRNILPLIRRIDNKNVIEQAAVIKALNQENIDLHSGNDQISRSMYGNPRYRKVVFKDWRYFKKSYKIDYWRLKIKEPGNEEISI